MRAKLCALLATASVFTVGDAGIARAQAAPEAEPTSLGEIVVTARRRSESLQEVPQTVNAVTADTLQKLNIQQFADVSSLAPGLTLVQSTNGYESSASLRGVTFNVRSGASPTTQFYINDAPIEANTILQAIFDVGQVEVLRGPQGTTRGEPAPSGAITFTSRRPDLGAFGGSINLSLSDLQGRNLQTALNVPIIKDVLAVRFAGLIDDNDTGGVRSIHNALRPYSKTDAFRTSLSYEPSDALNLNVMWQHLDRQVANFQQVFGSGSGGGQFSFLSTSGRINGVTVPANYNGPPLTLEQLASVQDAPARLRQHADVVTAQADSRIFGQHLSYVGSYTFYKIRTLFATDPYNVVPRYELQGPLFTAQTSTSQEIRLASDPAPGRFFDYTLGAFYDWRETQGFSTQAGSIVLANAFGSPASPFTFNRAGTFDIIVNVPSATQEYSIFGATTFHLGSATELSLGARQIFYMSSNDQNLRLAPPLNLPLLDLYRHGSFKPWIYTVSLSHHLSRDLLVYFNAGSSWRAGPQAPGITNAKNDPELAALTFADPEKSRSYEIGLKSTFLDGRARANLAIYHQTFDGFIFTGPTVPYLRCGSPTQALSTCSTASYGFTSNADAVVDGVDLDAALQITHDWNLSFQASYADGHLQNASVPCNDGNFDGVPDTIPVTSPAGFVAHNEFVALCKSNQPLSDGPYWSATITTEYVHPITEGVQGFVRGLVTISPEARKPVTGAPPVDGYQLVNLFAGVRSADGAWEASIYARNALENRTVLTGNFVAPGDLGGQFIGNATVSGGSGYYTGSLVERREVGVNVRYAFGSR